MFDKNERSCYFMPMKKGLATRTEILDAAFETARREGMEALTIGGLAKSVDMSKSGLFAHFESKANLQQAVLDHASAIFVEQVVRPAFQQERGEPRLRALFENWINWAQSKCDEGGCIFIAAAAEFDDSEGPVRDKLVETQEMWLETLSRTIAMAQEEKHFRTDLDARVVAYKVYANMMAFHFYARLLRDRDAERHARASFASLLEECRN